MDPSLGTRVQGRARVEEIERQGLFAENLFARGGGRLDILCVKFVWGGYDDRFDVLSFQHFFHTGKRVIDLKFQRDPARMFSTDVRDGDKSRVGHKPADILCVPPSHCADTKHTDS
jgi:hypothetical protein